MWKALIAVAAILSGSALAQAPLAELSPYVAALKAAGAYLPGSSLKSLHLANYDDASHRALAREAFTAGILGGLLTPAAQLSAVGSTIPTGVRWSAKHYLLVSESQCEVFINVRDVSSAIAQRVPEHAAFSVWHELAHCMMLELMDASAAGQGGQKAAAQRVTAELGAVLPTGRGQLAYTLLSEAFADSFALLVQASERGNAAASDMARALQSFRRQEQAAQAARGNGGGHDTNIALGLLIAALAANDLSGLSAHDRYQLAMSLAAEGTARWVHREVGAEAAAGARSVLRQLQRSLLPAATDAARAAPPAVALPVYLDFPGVGRQTSQRLM